MRAYTKHCRSFKRNLNRAFLGVKCCSSRCTCLCPCRHTTLKDDINRHTPYGNSAFNGCISRYRCANLCLSLSLNGTIFIHRKLSLNFSDNFSRERHFA